VLPGWSLCEIDCWRGYLYGEFVAVRDHETFVARSASFRWRRREEIPGQSTAAQNRLNELCDRLTGLGWEYEGPRREDAWFALGFCRPEPVPSHPPEPQDGHNAVIEDAGPLPAQPEQPRELDEHPAEAHDAPAAAVVSAVPVPLHAERSAAAAEESGEDARQWPEPALAEAELLLALLGRQSTAGGEPKTRRARRRSQLLSLAGLSWRSLRSPR
jgi:hypothetical protein